METNSTPKKKMSLGKKILFGLIAFFVFAMLLPKKDSEPAESQAAITTEPVTKDVEKVEPLPFKPKTTAEVDKALSGFKVSKDEFQASRFYNDPASAKYANTNSVHAYLGRDENDFVWPRMVIQYANDGWLFVESYHFMVNDNKLTILPTENIKRDNNGDGVWEVLDQKPSETDLLILREIANSKEPVKMRYEGREKIFDRTISEKEKKSLKKVLDTYYELKQG